MAQNIRLNLYLYNALLFLCSNSVSDSGTKETAVEFGLRVFYQMKKDGVETNEATTRLAAAKGDGELAFSLAKEIGRLGLVPKLRSYDPALFYFCENMQAEKAYEVKAHMRMAGVGLEEQEMRALLKVSSEAGNGERVYDYLQKLRKLVRHVSVETANVIEDWFKSKAAFEVESLDMDQTGIKEALLKNGGGFHGLGWIGEGKWNVSRTEINTDFKCEACGGKLLCVDIDSTETEKFAQSLASLAIERETKAHFRQFMLEDVVKELHSEKHKKRPLIILHTKRLREFMGTPGRKLLEEWHSQDLIYDTPHGSIDDWYLLYAAIRLKCLVVTNDELRDHIFELLGRSFITQWKERHQIRYTFAKGSPRLQMPPPYSTVIQESENGMWHVPFTRIESNGEIRTWLCVTRTSTIKVPPSNDGDSETRTDIQKYLIRVTLSSQKATAAR